MPIVNSNEDLKRYEEFVKNSPYGTFYQDPAWSKVKNNWTHDFVYIEENKQIIAAMSVLGIKNKNGKYFLYAPRGPVCDFTDYELVDKLIKEAEVLKEKYDAFLLRIDPQFKFEERPIHQYKKMGYDFRSVCDPIHSFTQPRYNMIIDLSLGDEEKIFENFSSKGRYNIRKSIKAGIETKIETNEKTLDNFYELTEIMAKRQGITYRPKEYHKRLVENYRCKIFSSYYEGEVLCSSIVVPYKDGLTYLYAASSNEKRNKMPNYNMLWEEIKYGVENGYKSLDLGGVFSLDKKDGLYRYKEHFCYPNKYTAYIGELDVVYDRDLYNEFLNNK